MNKTNIRPISTTLLAFAFALSLIAYFVVSAAAQSRSAATPPVIFDPAGGMVVFPRSTVIQWDDSVARFDSTTGAIHRLNGTLNAPQTKAEWVVEVPPVRERTSGMLRLQHPEGIMHNIHAIHATFLVDVVTGDTWILRSRDVRPRWDKVELAPH